MPSSKSNSNKFTNRDLALFYTRFLQHYNECKAYYLPNNIQGLSNEMYTAMYNALYVQSANSHLFDLESSEKIKVHQAFNAFFEALTSKPGYIPAYIPYAPQEQPRQETVIVGRTFNNYYYRHDSFLLDWWLISNLMNNCHHHHHHFPYSSGGYSGGHNHGHASSALNDGKALAILALIALALVAVVASYFALHYMFVHSLEGMDRFYYNEGWLKAALMLATSIGFGASSAIVSLTFATGSLTGLALMAGLNPAVAVVTAAVVFSIVGAGVGAWAMNTLYGSLTKNSGKDEIDPKDPLRYRLTVAEEKNLINKGIDPYKVKCALVILRGEVAKLTGKEQTLPTFLSRTTEQSKLLRQVREFRSGKRIELDVGGMYLNCREIVLPAYNAAYANGDSSAHNPSSYPGAGFFNAQQQQPQYPQPSAPPVPSYAEWQGWETSNMYPSFN